MDPVFESVETYTPEEFTTWVREREMAGDAHHYELLRGKIVMTPPAGWPHGSVASRINGPMGAFVRSKNLGEVFDSSQGFLLPSRDIVEPDVSFVSAGRLAVAKPVPEEFLRVVPDLVVEILSSHRRRDEIDKREIYESQHVREYWIVDPRARQIVVLLYDGTRFRELHTTQADGVVRSAVLEGFALPARDVFPDSRSV